MVGTHLPARPGGRVSGGGKARGLDALRARGFAVPPYVVVPPGAAIPPVEGGPFAVRSSARHEDGAERSHAGEFLTRLDVPRDQLAAAVAEVAASGDPPIAVVVQAMVQAELAGVVFTADPRSGDVDVVVVEWVEGLGEALVSGRASPHRAELGPGAVVDLPPSVAEAVAAARQIGTTGPVDVEWAWGALTGTSERRLWLLQARPITTAHPRRLALANTNTRELFPEVLRPMSVDVAQRVVRRIMGPLLQPFGLDPGAASLLAVQRGRAYFCLNPIASWLLALPGLRWTSPARLGGLLGGSEAAIGAAIARLRPGDLPLAALPATTLLAAGFGFLRALWRHRSGTAPEDLARVQAETAALVGPPADLDDDALLQRIDACLSEPETPTMIPAAFIGFLGAGLAEALGRWWGLPTSRWLTTQGTAGAGAGHALRMLGPDADLAPFLDRWGHRAAGEMDVALPRWAEEPERLRAQLRAGTRPAPEEPVEPTGWRAALVRAIARRGGQGLATREAFKDDMVRRIAHLRAALIEVGQRLVERGRLQDPDDVFFLHLSELGPALAGDLPDLTPRHTRWEADRVAAEPPAVLVLGDAAWVDPGSAPMAGDLRGLPASPGRATGRARVRRHGDLRPIRPGEVLVAPFTDPGWTPLLAAAGAVVTDIGGVLSHASIIARELGVPAVVNCRDATARIPEGALVEVDGDRGTVRIVEEATRGAP